MLQNVSLSGPTLDYRNRDKGRNREQDHSQRDRYQPQPHNGNEQRADLKFKDAWRDFKANLRPILLLSVGLVIFTTVVVAAVLKALVPDLPWAAAFAFGASSRKNSGWSSGWTWMRCTSCAGLRAA